VSAKSLLNTLGVWGEEEILCEYPELPSPWFEPANGILNYPDFASVYIHYDGAGYAYYTDTGVDPTEEDTLVAGGIAEYTYTTPVMIKCKAFAGGYEPVLASVACSGVIIEQPSISKTTDEPYYLEVGIDCYSTGTQSADCYTKADAGLWETGVSNYYFIGNFCNRFQTSF
jgi:hypothetical protein